MHSVRFKPRHRPPAPGRPDHAKARHVNSKTPELKTQSAGMEEPRATARATSYKLVSMVTPNTAAKVRMNVSQFVSLFSMQLANKFLSKVANFHDHIKGTATIVLTSVRSATLGADAKLLPNRNLLIEASLKRLARDAQTRKPTIKAQPRKLMIEAPPAKTTVPQHPFSEFGAERTRLVTLLHTMGRLSHDARLSALGETASSTTTHPYSAPVVTYAAAKPPLYLAPPVQTSTQPTSSQSVETVSRGQRYCEANEGSIGEVPLHEEVLYLGFANDMLATVQKHRPEHARSKGASHAEQTAAFQKEKRIVRDDHIADHIKWCLGDVKDSDCKNGSLHKTLSEIDATPSNQRKPMETYFTEDFVKRWKVRFDEGAIMIAPMDIYTKYIAKGEYWGYKSGNFITTKKELAAVVASFPKGTPSTRIFQAMAEKVGLDADRYRHGGVMGMVSRQYSEELGLRGADGTSEGVNGRWWGGTRTDMGATEGFMDQASLNRMVIFQLSDWDNMDQLKEGNHQEMLPEIQAEYQKRLELEKQQEQKTKTKQ